MAVALRSAGDGAPARRRAVLLPSLFIASFALSATLFYILISFNPSFGHPRIRSTDYHGYRSAFSFDAGVLCGGDADGDGDGDGHGDIRLRHSHDGEGGCSSAAWMAALPDSTNLSSLSIPGTHDTLTFLVEDDGYQCQNHDLATQLLAGVRYVDVRARQREDGTLHIYHGNVYTGFSYEDVLRTLFAFLESHPTETILMRLKQEGPPFGHRPNLTFEEAFNAVRLDSPLAEGCKKHFFGLEDIVDTSLEMGKNQSFDTLPLPTLGALRGKIFILQNFPAVAGAAVYGLPWEKPPMQLEDLWIIPDVYHLNLKWEAIRNALESAASSPDDNEVLFLAHVSAAVGVLPIEAAAGLRNHTVVGMNDETGQFLAAGGAGGPTGRTGVVIMDFPGQKLIDAVVGRNGGLAAAMT